MSSQDNDTLCLMLVGAFWTIVIMFIVSHDSATIPSYLFPMLKIDSIKVSDFNLSNPISAHWKIDMNIIHLHSKDISYGFYDNVVSIFHESKATALWTTDLKQFALNPSRPNAHFTQDFWGTSTEVSNTTLNAIVGRIANNYGAVKFIVQFKVHKPTVWFAKGIHRLWYDKNIDVLVISCDVELLFGSPDKTIANMLLNDSKACRVRVVNS